MAFFHVMLDEVVKVRRHLLVDAADPSKALELARQHKTDDRAIIANKVEPGEVISWSAGTGSETTVDDFINRFMEDE